MQLVPQLRRTRANLAWTCAAMASGMVPFTATADTASDKALSQQVQKLLDRVQQLEQRNQSLERRVEDLTKAVPAAAPVTAVSPATVASPAEVNGEVADARLKAIEQQQIKLKQQVQALARPLEPAEEAGGDSPKFEANLLGVYQQANRRSSESGKNDGRFNFRGDILATLPAGTIGNARGTVGGQVRFGQGGGVALRPTHTGTVNSTAFEANAGSDQTYGVIAQAYYQIEWPLEGSQFVGQATTRVEAKLGKLDIFTLFDQNEVAGDEAASFLNNVFVHNPLLDSGGDIAADSFGFAPGGRVAYFNEGDEYGWGLSMGVFAAGEKGSQFNGSAGKPLVIAQAQFSPKQINGEARGNYRAYVWSNGRTSDFDGREQRHTGFGLSVDQRVGGEWNLFGRYGVRTSGEGPFNSAVTLGFEHGGRLWGRNRDAVGFAIGSLSTSSKWRRATGDDLSLVGFRASGQERIAEIFYRLTLNDQLVISPDFQLIDRPGGDGGVSTARVFGVRASVSF